MTNEDMLALALNRTRAFYERVYKPFGLTADADLGRVESHLKKCFSQCASQPRLCIAFLNDIDRIETEIVWHRKIPASIRLEVQEAINSVVTEKAMDDVMRLMKSVDRSR